MKVQGPDCYKWASFPLHNMVGIESWMMVLSTGQHGAKVDVESYRIYIKGTNFPGLTMYPGRIFLIAC